MSWFPKAQIKRVHRTISLAFALLWLLQAVTGALIVFHWEVDDALVRGPDRPVDIAALGRQIEALPKAAGPGWAFSSMWTSAGSPGRFDIDIANEESGASQSIRVAGDGTVLRRRSSGEDWGQGAWIGKLVVLHQKLLSGDTGSWIVGISGILLLTNILLGLRLALPPRRAWTCALRPSRKGPPPARTYGWHRAVGLWIGVPALILVSCGTLLVFEDGIGTALGSVPPEPAVAVSNAPLVESPTAAMRAALARYPGATLVSLGPPSAEAPWYDIGLLQPGELRRAYGKTSVLVDARTGGIVQTLDPFAAPAPRAFMDSLFPIHTGEAGGLPGRLLVMMTGLGLATMVVLGVRLWWLRRG
jgi:uncharacterized iron-regulated membrane protein